MSMGFHQQTGFGAKWANKRRKLAQTPVNVSLTSARRENDSPALSSAALLQLRVLSFGSLQERNVVVGVFPERGEILVGAPRPDLNPTASIVERG